MKIIRNIFLILLFSLIIAQFGAINVGPFAQMFLHDVILIILIISWLVYGLFIRKKFFIPSLFLPMFAFIIWAFVTLVLGSLRLSLSPTDFLVSLMFFLRLSAYLSVFLIVFDLVKGELKTSIVIIKSFVIITVVISLLGFLQLIFFPSPENVALSVGWDPHRGRLFSTFLDPNFVGAFIGINLISMLLLFQFKFKRFNSFKPFLYVAILISTPALSLTLSRSAWLLFTTSSVVLGVFKSKIFLAFALIFLIATILLVPNAKERLAPFSSVLTTKTESLGEKVKLVDQSALARLGSWNRGIRLFKENPITGVGFNTIRFVSARQGFFGEDDLGGRAGAGVDSSLLFVLATTGAVGVGIFFLVGVKILKDSFSAFRNKTSELGSFLGLLVFSTFSGLLFESNFINSIFYPQILLWLLTVLGLFYATREQGIEITKIGDIRSYLSLGYKKKLRLIKQIKKKIQL